MAFSSLCQPINNHLRDNLVKKITLTLPNDSRVSLELQLGRYYLYSSVKNKSALDSAYIFFDKAWILSAALHNGVLKSKTISFVKHAEDFADTNLSNGKIELAQAVLFKTIAFYKKVNYLKNQYAYYLLSEGYKFKGEMSTALFYDMQALKSMEATADTLHGDQFYYEIGCTYCEIKQYGQGAVYLKKALEISRERKDVAAFYLVLNTLVTSEIHIGKAGDALVILLNSTKGLAPINVVERKFYNESFGSCYYALKQNVRAEKFYLKMIGFTNSIAITNNVILDNWIHDYITISRFYVKMHQLKKADYFLKCLSAISPKNVNPLEMNMLQKIKFEADSASGNYLLALKEFENYKKLNDSLFGSQKSRQIDQLRFKYETEQKNEDLLLQAKNIQLLKKQKQLQAVNISQSRVERNYTIAGVIILSLLLGFVYLRYRAKHRGNILLQQKQKEITEKNIALKNLLKENEWLLIEVHHRVKNNLQTVTGLLSSQSIYLKDKIALDAITEIQHRVQSMALIHQKLYKTNNFTSIYMPDYLRELVDYLKDSYDTRYSIYFDMGIEPIYLDVSYTVPLGLIVNEIVTNAIKYAFIAGNDNKIEIKLFEKNELVILAVKDNGKGLPKDFDSNQNSFGMLLMNGLTEEMGGRFRIFTDGGTTVQVCFDPVIQPTRRAG
jgi:two-component sensor histidine kinase